VTLRAAHDLPNLRQWRLAQAIGLALRAAASRPGARCKVRVLHFSIQDDHVHLVVEANDARDLANGMRGLNVRLARAVNRELGRRGPFSADRYHARPLRTPREVRHALVYVLANWRKHTAARDGLDPCSSARWFDGWTRQMPRESNPPPTHAPSTWLARSGWKRHGLIDPCERPAG
jgi:putative transposase